MREMDTSTNAISEEDDRREVARGTVSIQEMQSRYGIGRTLVYDLLGRGELRGVRVGRRRLITVESIERLLVKGLS